MLLGSKLREAPGEHLIASTDALESIDGVWGDTLPSRTGEVVPEPTTDLASVRACLGTSACAGDLVPPDNLSTIARLGDCVPEGTSATGKVTGKVDDRITPVISTGARPTDRVPDRASADARPGDCVPPSTLTFCRAISARKSECALPGLVVPD